jgi:dihydroorotate dehydrogenase
LFTRKAERAALALLRHLPPEVAHATAIKALEKGLYPSKARSSDRRLAVERFGLRFPNPVGIAAGLDKDARVFRALLDLGAGFAEVGTVTPRPQAGNPKPRLFRLPADRAIINRLGFNNCGHAAARGRLGLKLPGIVGVNVGANKDSPDRTVDYVRGVETFAATASYLMVNISSPNTPGLRNLQAPAELDDLLVQVLEARERSVRLGTPRRPILVKLAPDLADDDLSGVVAVLMRRGVDGIAVSNTTLARDGLRDQRSSDEAGGLSGRPLFRRSTRILARVFLLSEGKVPLVGIGGIDSPERAIEKIEAGAALIQLYTALVFDGFDLIERIKAGLVAEIARRGLTSIDPIVGTRAKAWADEPL